MTIENRYHDDPYDFVYTEDDVSKYEGLEIMKPQEAKKMVATFLQSHITLINETIKSYALTGLTSATFSANQLGIDIMHLNTIADIFKSNGWEIFLFNDKLEISWEIK